MKRVVLAVSVCIVGFALAAASANAASVKVEGSCVVKGPAKFNPSLTVLPGAVLTSEYKFKSSSVTCTTSPESSEGVAEVKGEAHISCVLSLGGEFELELVSPHGTGSVKYKVGAETRTHEITDFKFTGLLNEVFKLQANGPEVKVKDGSAKFEAANAVGCATGLESVEFEAKIPIGSEL